MVAVEALARQWPNEGLSVCESSMGHLAYPQRMGLRDLAETGLPPATLVEFVERCLSIDTTTIVDVAMPSIQREIYDVGWDRYAICWELTAKEQILERYKTVTAELQALEALPDTQRPAYATELCAARARADEAGRAFMAIATTYKDRYGYGRAVRGDDGWKL